MTPIILGILAGIGLPIQTSINTRLREHVGSPYRASLVSFAMALVLLLGMLVVTGQGIGFPFARLAREPVWIWLGGVCGVIFLTGNILLLSKVGSVQTVVLPVLGQILMGLVIDSSGLFYAERSQLTLMRVVGAVLVVVGVLVVSMAKDVTRGDIRVELQEVEDEVAADIARAAHERRAGAQTRGLWLWRVFGVGAGMLSATQVAVNGYLGSVVDSPIKASAISFVVGIVCLGIVCVVMRWKGSETNLAPCQQGTHPWWMWFGGVLGGLYILANVTLSGQVGTGMTVIVLLIGATVGGLLVDHFGLFGTNKKPVNAMKILGVLIMVAGAVAIKVL